MPHISKTILLFSALALALSPTAAHASVKSQAVKISHDVLKTIQEWGTELAREGGKKGVEEGVKEGVKEGLKRIQHRNKDDH